MNKIENRGLRGVSPYCHFQHWASTLFYFLAIFIYVFVNINFGVSLQFARLGQNKDYVEYFYFCKFIFRSNQTRRHEHFPPISAHLKVLYFVPLEKLFFCAFDASMFHGIKHFTSNIRSNLASPHKQAVCLPKQRYQWFISDSFFVIFNLRILLH